MGLLNEIDTSWSTPRLSDVLFSPNRRIFGSLAALPSNVEAIEACLLFSAGLSTLVTLVGPSGWGKSHLLEAVANRKSAQEDEPVEIRSGAHFVSDPCRTEPSVLVLDDVQDVLSKARLRQALRLTLERRVRAGRPTLLAFTMPKPSRTLKSLLPSPREWAIATMGEPSPDERIQLVNQLSKAEGLSLSPGLVRIMALQMHGNGRTFAGAMKRLRLASQSWLGTWATLRACGMLDPFFADNSAWDLKHKILATAEGHRAQFSRAASLDMALYVMLHVAGLGEADVARAAQIAPADAYQRASRFSRLTDESCEMRGYVAQFVETVVAALGNE